MNATEKDTTYNGWTNYETWNVALWIDNEQGSQLYWKETAEEAYRDAERGEDRKWDAVCAVADRLKDEINEAAPDLGATCFADLLGAALSKVNWHEIAEHYIDDVFAEIDDEEREEADEDA